MNDLQKKTYELLAYVMFLLDQNCDSDGYVVKATSVQLTNIIWLSLIQFFI